MIRLRRPATAGEFQEFPVSMGPLPQVDKMVFKVLQTLGIAGLAGLILGGVAFLRTRREPTPRD